MSSPALALVPSPPPQPLPHNASGRARFILDLQCFRGNCVVYLRIFSVRIFATTRLISRHTERTYLCELALLDDVPYLQFLPSIVAGSALCLANHTLGRHPWGQELVEYSGYEVTAFRECVHSLYSSFCNAPSRPQRAVHDKFKTPK
ncbi:hypothetical protein HPB48_007261 [Haemaphysalis longicornis]|uniref:Cyclin C-terminal domain-containing protein n=1 Tax=Haemaphysalis longicornis TaxID=44386 RepID=A0A9J6GL54_HAELO|nr:hypothetical protein HPB48_007261 [Haemaphysalis longicornis]